MISKLSYSSSGLRLIICNIISCPDFAAVFD